MLDESVQWKTTRPMRPRSDDWYFAILWSSPKSFSARSICIYFGNCLQYKSYKTNDKASWRNHVQKKERDEEKAAEQPNFAKSNQQKTLRWLTYIRADSSADFDYMVGSFMLCCSYTCTSAWFFPAARRSLSRFHFLEKLSFFCQCYFAWKSFEKSYTVRWPQPPSISKNKPAIFYWQTLGREAEDPT